MNKFTKEIKGVFKQPVKKFYFGKLTYGAPYFYPTNFEKSFFYFRRLKRRTTEDYSNYVKRFPHLVDTPGAKFSNVPMVRRNKDWIFKFLGIWWYLTIGSPIAIKFVSLGWKDKFDAPRFEWLPAFYIYFFKWQFCIFWKSPDGDDDLYYEMILWYLYYSKSDLSVAEETWPWSDSKTKISTWNKNYLIK